MAPPTPVFHRRTCHVMAHFCAPSHMARDSRHANEHSRENTFSARLHVPHRHATVKLMREECYRDSISCRNECHPMHPPSQNEYRPLYVTGHSLGGALASLAAFDIDKNFNLPDPMTLYT